MGHPDWQTYTDWRAVPIVAEQISFPAGVTVIGVFPVHNYQSILGICNTSADHIVTEFDFTTDLAGLTVVDNYLLNLSASVEAKLLIPVSANFVKISVNNTSGGAAVVAVNATPVNVPVRKPVFFANLNEINVVNTAVPASSNSFFTLPFIQPGLAHLWLNPRDATGKLNFLIRSGSPAVLGPAIYVNNGPTVFDQRLIGLTDRAYLLEVSNTDGAAAHSFDASLIPVG